MPLIKFVLALLATWGLIYVFNKTWIVEKDGKQTQTPRFGAFLSPSTGFWQNAEGKMPQLPASLQGRALSAPVKILYDDRFVPHIFAANTKDAYFAQGYATAALRLWQMEFQTHAAAGRLSELIGHTTPQVMDLDLQTRRSGLPRAAAKAVEEWKKDTATYALLESYSDGVNAYISSLSPSEYPIEYKLLDYAPERWSTYKSSLLLKFMARDLTGRDEDFHTTNAYYLLGATLYGKLYPEYFPEQSPIVGDSLWAFTPTIPSLMLRRDTIRPAAALNPRVDSAIGALGEPLRAPFEQPDRGLGSNNWAVAPAKTAGGKAILCNDPHLRLSLPSIWFEIQIHTPEFNVYGASLPGSPGVISGFNEHVAWGVTNVSHDVRDWYLIQWKDATRQEYLCDSAYRKAEHIIDTIHIRGGGIRLDTLIYTHWGPVAHSQNGMDFALRWTAHLPTLEPLTFLGLNKAKNYADYRAAIQHFACPAQNIVFASTSGDIAITVQGKLPLRRAYQGKLIQDGSSTAQAWSEFIPQEHLPHEYNPAKGFVGSANQHSTNPTYPYYYFGYFEEHRGRYLNQQLAQMKAIKVEDMMRLQTDNYSIRARDFQTLFLRFLRRGELNKDQLELLARLEKWNFQYNATEIAPVIFEAWFKQVYHEMYDEIADINQTNALTDKTKVYYPEEWHLMQLLKRDTLNAIIDQKRTPERVETLADIVTMSFKGAAAELGSIDTIANWRNKKSTNILHLARLAPFSFMNIDVGGDGSALNAMTPTNGPSWRMVVELGGKAYGIYPGGQSGNVGSPFYASMLDKWTKGEYYELLFLSKADAAPAEKILFQQELTQ